MSFYDPTTYNDSALNEEELGLIRMYDYAIEDAGNKEFIIDDILGLDDEEGSIFVQMQREVASKTIDAVIEYLQTKRQEMIVAWLDARAAEEEDNISNKI